MTSYESLTDALDRGDYRKITSVLIIRDGSAAFEWYGAGMNASTLHNTRSATKTVTGILVGIAIQQGLRMSAEIPISTIFRSARVSGTLTRARTRSRLRTCSR